MTDGHDIDSETDSDFSDTDYELTSEDCVQILEFGTGHEDTCPSIERLQTLWNKQSGLCYISNLPMTLPMTYSKTMYSVNIAPRRVSEPISDSNSVLVCAAIKAMRESTNMTWSQFKTFVAHISSN